MQFLNSQLIIALRGYPRNLPAEHKYTAEEITFVRRLFCVEARDFTYKSRGLKCDT
jgi:hypothetical protein